MYTRFLFRLILTGLLGLMLSPVSAQEAVDEEFLYGRQLTTEQERDQFRQQLQNAESEQERRRIQSEHRSMIQERAKARGMNGDGIYGHQLMTQEERRAYHDRLQNAQSARERQRIRSEHRQMMDERMLQQRKRQRMHEPGTGGGTGAGMRHGGSDGAGQGSGARQGGGKGGGRGSADDDLRGKGRNR